MQTPCYSLVFYIQSLDKEGEARENYQFDFEQPVAIFKTQVNEC